MKYSIEEIDAVFIEHELLSSKQIQDRLVNSNWKPKIGQVYHYKLVSISGYALHIGDLISKPRPLTTKEAGPECMEHLVTALENMSNVSYKLSSTKAFCINALQQHKELTKY